MAEPIRAALEVVILDDDPEVCLVLAEMVGTIHPKGPIHSFNDYGQALEHCRQSGQGVGIFILDVFLGGKTAFDFLGEVSAHYPMAAEDCIIITGNASGDVVDRCVEAGVNHLLEKPLRLYDLHFAVRAVAAKYLKFARMLVEDPEFAQMVVSLDSPEN